MGNTFGNAVSISRNYTIVGAPQDQAGSAYLFRNDGTQWTQAAKLTASDAAEVDFYGRRVAIMGDDAFVGAFWDIHQAGSVYVYSGFLKQSAIPDEVIDSSSAVYTKKTMEKGSVAEAIPERTELSGNYPNPFNPSTSIRYALSEPTHVIFRIYNMLGQLVATLVDETQVGGYKSVVWNGKNDSGASVASGIYVYRLTTGNSVQSKKMLLMK